MTAIVVYAHAPGARVLGCGMSRLLDYFYLFLQGLNVLFHASKVRNPRGRGHDGNELDRSEVVASRGRLSGQVLRS